MPEPRAIPTAPGSRLLLILLLASQLALFLGGLHRSLHGSTDFRAFYGAGRLLLEGHGDKIYRHDAQEQIERQFISPDDQTLPFLYPPFAAHLFVPLAALPYKLAFACFTFISAASLLLTSACLCHGQTSFCPAPNNPLKSSGNCPKIPSCLPDNSQKNRALQKQSATAAIPGPLVITPRSKGCY